jgi:hypothetical protein
MIMVYSKYRILRLRSQGIGMMRRMGSGRHLSSRFVDLFSLLMPYAILAGLHYSCRE